MKRKREGKQRTSDVAVQVAGFRLQIPLPFFQLIHRLFWGLRRWRGGRGGGFLAEEKVHRLALFFCVCQQ